MRAGLFAVFAFLLGSVLPAFSNEAGFESPDALLKEVTQSIEHKSKARFLQCSCLERLPEKLKAQLQASTPSFMSHDMEWIKLRPGAGDPMAALEGFEYNVQFSGTIEVKYKTLDDPLSMPFGQYKGRFYLATLVKKGTFTE